MRFENLRSKAILRIIVGSTKKIFYGEISFYYSTKICHKTNFLYIPAKASKQPLVSVPIILDHPVRSSFLIRVFKIGVTFAFWMRAFISRKPQEH